jgi:hypothetical protein
MTSLHDVCIAECQLPHIGGLIFDCAPKPPEKGGAAF